MAFKPIMMKHVDLILGDPATGPNFKCQVRQIKLAPSSSPQKLKTACPEGRYADVSDPEWDLEVGYAYGFDNGEGDPVEILSDFLMDRAGTKVPFLYRPQAGGRGYAGEVTIMAGDIGAQVDAWMEGSVSLPVDGQPRRVDAVAGGTAEGQRFAGGE